MTSPKKAPKPHKLALDAARAELLRMALDDQRISLRRTLRLQEANPKPNAEEKYEIEQTKAQLATSLGLHKEIYDAEKNFKEW